MNFSRLSLLSFLFAVLLLAAGCGKPQRKEVTKLDDLPRHTYALTGKAADLIADPARFDALAAKVKADTESDLAHFDIRDKTTLKRLKGVLLQLSLLRHDDAESLRLIGEIRALADKPSERYVTGLVSESRIAAQREAGGTGSEAYTEKLRQELEQRIAAMPWPVVQADLKEMKGDFDTRSRNLLLGIIESEVEPAVAKTGVLSYDVATRLIGVRAYIELSLPIAGEVAATLGQVIDAHRIVKPDIWAARAIAFAPGQALTPVAVGIWDSGVDLPLFPRQTALGADGKPLGIAYDLYSDPAPGFLYPIKDPSRLAEMKGQIKGSLDIDADIDSPEAAAVRAKMAAIKPDEVRPYLEELEMFGNYAHGTHVAGIAVAGNPAARIVVGRITFDYKSIPEVPTVAQARKDVLSYQATIDFFRRNHVRVANMSWGGSLKDVEQALEANGAGKDATERAKMAREIFDIGKDGLYRAMADAPDILFVTAAGNSDNDVAFDEETPSSFKLPNILVVGAVDQAGDETSFTSFGENVPVYADGFEVDSLIPGGDHMRFSGTSMASPNVANLAAKLFAVDPALTPVEVIDLIRRGSDKGADPRITLIDPKQSMALLQAQLKK